MFCGGFLSPLPFYSFSSSPSGKTPPMNTRNALLGSKPVSPAFLVLRKASQSFHLTRKLTVQNIWIRLLNCPTGRQNCQYRLPNSLHPQTPRYHAPFAPPMARMVSLPPHPTKRKCLEETTPRKSLVVIQVPHQHTTKERKPLGPFAISLPLTRRWRPYLCIISQASRLTSTRSHCLGYLHLIQDLEQGIPLFILVPSLIPQTMFLKLISTQHILRNCDHLMWISYFIYLLCTLSFDVLHEYLFYFNVIL